jgi:hypothetical protein
MMGMMGRNGAASSFAEGRIAFIKAELAITDAQSGAREIYASALRKNFESMQSMRKTMMGATSRPIPWTGSISTSRRWNRGCNR